MTFTNKKICEKTQQTECQNLDKIYYFLKFNNI